jgi:UDP-glucose 4-epimerase
MSKQAKYLITGGAGFIGSQLVDFYLKEGHKILTIDNLSWGKKEFISHNLKNPNFKFINLDLLDFNKLLNNINSDVDVVFHLAANSDIKRGVENPATDFKNTTIVTFNLLQVMRIKKIKKIFYTSGSGVYGDVGKKYTKENFGPLCPVSMYGATKLSAEAMISAFVNLFNMQAWILRPANIIGPRATHGVVFDFINKLQKNPKELEILGDGNQSKSYLYITDVIDAIDLVWKKAKNKVNIFNVTSSTFITVSEIAQIITREMGLKNVRLKYTGGAVGWIGDVPIVRISNTKIRRIGWVSHFTSRQAVIKTVQGLLNKK